MFRINIKVQRKRDRFEESQTVIQGRDHFQQSALSISSVLRCEDSGKSEDAIANENRRGVAGKKIRS